jgi:hypothetical protein
LSVYKNKAPDRNPVRGKMVEAAGQWFRIFQCGLDYAFTKIGVRAGFFHSAMAEKNDLLKNRL